MIYTESKNEQGTPEWFAERRGIPTASMFKRFITATGKYSESIGKDSYIAELIAASCGWIPDFDGNDDTHRGHYLEDEARRWRDKLLHDDEQPTQKPELDVDEFQRLLDERDVPSRTELETLSQQLESLMTKLEALDENSENDE